MKRLFLVAGFFCLVCAGVVFGQVPTISRVVDAASFTSLLAPGSLANVIGTNLGNSTSIQVTVGGKVCAVLSASPTQLQIQIAVDASLGATTLQVGTSAPFNISLAQYAPVLFSADGSGTGSVQASHADGTSVTPSSPAEAGEVILMPAIGLGPTSAMTPTGAISPANPPAFITSPLTLSIADKVAMVLFAGLTPGKVGVYQINFLMPADIATGLQPITLTLGGERVVSNLTLPSSDAPVIRALQNNYSYIMPGLPNYGIAQGSIFIIYGLNLASSSIPLQTSYPLNTSLGEVSVSVIVNGTTTHPILYYVTRTQLAAILPSATPVGTGQITVTTNGQTGPSAPIQVVQSAFGILTLNNAGTGPAAALDAKFNYLGLTNSIHPGEYVNLWGSGIGPADGDETNPQIPADLTQIPVEVNIGGISATVTYRGRSAYPGLDQVQAIVPAGVQPGCNVSVVVRTGNIVSNFATIPVAANGRTCSEPSLGIAADQLQSLLSKPSFTLGQIDIDKEINVSPPTTPGGAPVPGSISDRASAQFSRVPPAQFSGFQNPSAGSCVVYYNGYSFGAYNNGPFDAGPAINLNGPSAKLKLDPSGDDDGYYEFLGDALTLPIFIPDAGGTLNFDNGAGGPDAGAFSASLTLGTPLVWSNAANIATVNRSAGLTVTWTGGAGNSSVQISGIAAAPTPAFFTCVTPVAANHFTIPPEVLLALPPTGPDVHLFPTLSVANITSGTFTAPELDLGYILASVRSTILVSYQ